MLPPDRPFDTPTSGLAAIGWQSRALAAGAEVERLRESIKALVEAGERYGCNSQGWLAAKRKAGLMDYEAKAREWLAGWSIDKYKLLGILDGESGALMVSSLAALLEETAALNEVAQDMCDRVDAVMRGERRPGEALDECAARLIRERDEALERETLNRQAAEKWYESSESYRTLRDEARAEERERAKRIVGECEVAACNECEGDCARETCGEILRRLEDER